MAQVILNKKGKMTTMCKESTWYEENPIWDSIWRVDEEHPITTKDGDTYKFVRRYERKGLKGDDRLKTAPVNNFDFDKDTAPTDDFYLAECVGRDGRHTVQITDTFSKDFANKIWYNMAKNPTSSAVMLENISREGVDVFFMD